MREIGTSKPPSRQSLQRLKIHNDVRNKRHPSNGTGVTLPSIAHETNGGISWTTRCLLRGPIREKKCF